ncbi:MAG: hypothetical protein ACK47B_20150 [Armatimonadota bacterium]
MVFRSSLGQGLTMPPLLRLRLASAETRLQQYEELAARQMANQAAQKELEQLGVGHYPANSSVSRGDRRQSRK